MSGVARPSPDEAVAAGLGTFERWLSLWVAAAIVVGIAAGRLAPALVESLAADAQAYLAGLILLGAAPCTAMVFVWSDLVRGDAGYTLVQVGVNDVIMVFVYVPIVALLLGLSDIPILWNTLLVSVLLYVVVPLVVAGS